MSDTFPPSTQYEDLTGFVALDGHEASGLDLLAQIVGLDQRYVPIGLSLYRLHTDDDGLLPLQIVAVKSAGIGETIEELFRYAKARGDLPVHFLDVRIDPQQFIHVFKRVAVTAILKDFKDIPISRVPRDSH
jgi:hypothetical protein